MKPIKSITITLLFTSLSTTTIIGKSISTSTKTVAPPALPTKKDTSQKIITNIPAQTFKQLHDHIAAMKPEDVISKDNILSDYFINFVKDNVKRLNLPLIFTQALLEMGIHLHAQFSNDNKQALETLQKSNVQIQNILNILKPVTQTEKPKPPVEPVGQKKELSGIEKLQEFRKQSATQPLEKFYSQATINQEWLTKALNLILNGKPLTTQNKQGIQGEMVGNATELARELLHKNNITGQPRSIILESVEKQIITFMNNQLLADQKQQQQIPPAQLFLPIAPKKLSPQPTMPEPEKNVVEPIKKPTPLAEQKPEIILQLPAWITKEHTLTIKKFEIEMLSYIFKHENATQEEVVSYFAQQIPLQIQHREIIINAIKVIVAKNFEEFEASASSSEQSTTPSSVTKIEQKLPLWIDIEYDQLVNEIMNYLNRHPDASNDAIFNHLMKQLPSSMPDKKLIEQQVRTVIKRIFLSNEKGW